jgi:hypothetical protein
MVLWQPWGERNAISYADLAPNRDAGWLGGLLDGVAFGVVGVTLGLVVCVVAPARGAVWATAGAVLTGLGGVLFAAGIGPRATGFLLFTLGSLVLMVALWRSVRGGFRSWRRAGGRSCGPLRQRFIHSDGMVRVAWVARRSRPSAANSPNMKISAV